ncbi:glycosyltransferase [Pontibacter diazotrophicus]|uniref:Glycosyltransferase n=1 Tax=Pontibacter diazotrophicus TaxID=1400979 RepID=A0A3D8LGA0_9BACT|nr:glycosyltransferase [Pontibacter diazotrophicus]RDV16443.1 glycosyltransferase [Pontibacter diazotrophicus]
MSNSYEPLDVCVLIPCYNNLPGLFRTLQSICYPPGKLLVLVVDDGSEVPVTLDILRNSNINFPSIHVLNLEQNSGITLALNAGLKWIEDNLCVRYIARLDCADICHPEKFYKQVTFLNANPAIGFIGSWCTFQTPNATLQYGYSTPTAHSKIIREMHYRNVFIHPTVMFRVELIKTLGYYPTNYPHVEDYAYFWRMVKRTKTAILDDFLVTCEINVKGISIKNRKKQLKGRYNVVSEFGSIPHLKLLGMAKLRAMMLVPYYLILLLKNRKRRAN